jgi:hypothetical protein
MIAFVGKRAVVAASALVAFAALGACALEPDETTSVQAVQFQDVVVPSGMRIREENHRSWSREDASYRLAHLEYTGQNDIASAANYVRERMPQHNWNKVADAATDDGLKLKLRFVREAYAAEYTFSRSEGATTMVVDYTTDYERRDKNPQ